MTSAADYRRLTQLVLTTALERAGTWVCEPLADLSLEVPVETSQGVLALLGRLGGRVRGQFSANGVSRVQAMLPVARVRTLQNQLPGLSMGEGILESRPGGYQPVGGTTRRAANGRARARSTATRGSRRSRSGADATHVVTSGLPARVPTMTTDPFEAPGQWQTTTRGSSSNSRRTARTCVASRTGCSAR